MERCDDEKVVFNARVNEDEMIISINEYKELKARIEWQDDCINSRTREFGNLKAELEKTARENSMLKNGIVNFIKSMGGNYGQIR